MLTVYTRHSANCPKKSDPLWRRCRCSKWLTGSLPNRPGHVRMSAKTRSWEQAEQISRKYENKAMGGEDIKAQRTLPTIKEAVSGYIADAEARGLAEPTIQKLRQIFKRQLVGFADQHGFLFLVSVWISPLDREDVPYLELSTYF
jgi:integrase/recombinase XerD